MSRDALAFRGRCLIVPHSRGAVVPELCSVSHRLSPPQAPAVYTRGICLVEHKRNYTQAKRLVRFKDDRGTL